MTIKLLILLQLSVIVSSIQDDRKVGRLTEVFAWKQLTYDIDGVALTQDRVTNFEQNALLRRKRQSDLVYFKNEYMDERIWSDRPKPSQPNVGTNVNQSDAFFIQYNNVPMGVERVGDRVFITVPRRRYGIPSTLNYVELNQRERSPALKPYPDIRQARSLTSVYRTRADQCGRLWMVDTGLLEIPANPQQVQPPAIVIFDLNTDTQILRYQFKDEDIPAANTPTGLASITIDMQSDCASAYAYVPDLTTFGLIVYSLKDNDSWRLSHSYFHFNPIAGNLNIAGQNFQWNDGIFSITIKQTGRECNTAYFHPLISFHEFAVSTCVLNNKTAIQASNYWSLYSVVGERGDESQSTMHGHHAGSNVMFYAEIGRSAVTCWHTARLLKPSNIAILAKDNTRLSYPCDLHVTDDEVWVMANSLPRFSYSRLDTDEYNFFVYRASIKDLISGTICNN
ncbi:L-dopachrome tautomerase yellow-f2 isoform X2 [Manduca sexta]|uniref:Uncharacterized protein n=1 Tax=Manduca sexta TaxID=7130 RepID=A0A921ZUZ7_MANSE|nr:L-dopachrome tautomerase yellow-f2 isoform X2 [Manduca sexta]XP_037303490.1 L-dopachrome tautomerase yellow-f2 isoform X2 [Manduca sexta]KAG6464139.1 hypothetical protein O3G_MSEX014307 [Manduca sexta]